MVLPNGELVVGGSFSSAEDVSAKCADADDRSVLTPWLSLATTAWRVRETRGQAEPRSDA